MTKLVGEKVRMRIWIGEGDKYGEELLYEALVKLFREEGFAGATVIRGIAGYGARSIYRSGKRMEMSRDLPVIAIAVDTQEKIDRVMPKIDEMMSGGMITLETTTVLRYAHKHGERGRSPRTGDGGNSLRPLENILRWWAVGGTYEVPLLFKPANFFERSSFSAFLARPLLRLPYGIHPRRSMYP